MNAAVLVIHGMGSQSSSFADPMIEELSDRLANDGHDPALVAFQPVFWQDILEPRETAYLNNAIAQGDLDLVRLRRFVVTALGDAVAYQLVDSSSSTTYREVHARIADRVTDLYVNKLRSQPVPLIVCAHSLGCHIMSNYIWDMQHGRAQPMPTNSFERMAWLGGLVTFGCNIPLFTFAFQTVAPIAFPGPDLPANKRPHARWLNYYDPDDILGYPLKPINPAYHAVVDEDIAINAGGILSSWNPMSHNAYWTDNDLTKPVAQLIGELS